MTSLKEHVELKERPRAVDVPLEDRRLQPQSKKSLHVSRKVAMAVSLAVIATVATLALVLNSGFSEQRDMALPPNVVRSDLNYPSPGTIFPNGKDSNLHKDVVQSPSTALPSLLKVMTTAKVERENRVREMEELHSQKTVPNSDHNKEEMTVQKNEEHDFHKHSQNMRIQITNQQNTIPKVSTVSEEKTNENHNKNLHEMDQTNRNLVKSKTAQRLQIKESDRLPTRRLTNGSRVCETAECYEAATRISESLDRTADPCDDFYQFACGGWINNHSVPESGWAGTYIDAIERLDEDLLFILGTPAEPGAPAPLHEIRTLYYSCTDLNKLEEIGLDPLVSLLSGQNGWPMVEETWDPDSFNLTTAINNLRNLLVYPLIKVTVETDVFNTSQRLIFVDGGAVPLNVAVMASISEAALLPYRTFMTTAARMLRDHVGSNVTDQDIDEQVQGVIDFEIKFSKILVNAANETTNHAWQTTVAELQEDTDGGTPGQFKWLDFLEEMFAETDIVITDDEPLLSFKGPFFKDFSNMLATTDPKTIANALGWWWVYELQLDTTDAMRDASSSFLQDFYGSQPSSRQSHCLDVIIGNLAFALTREYVDKFVSSTLKPETSEMVEDLRLAFSSLLDNNTWMMPEDLKVAREKLAFIDPFPAYPEWIMNDEELTLGYEGLELRDQEYVYNLVHIGQWYNLNSLALLRDVPEHIFQHAPVMVNSFYVAIQNSIEILVGMLQPPYYAHNSLAALNYGGIGMIIGHEMTHGFDSSGRLYDKYGNLVQWWSDETIAAFNEHALCFVDQYNHYIPPELSHIGLNITVNGIQTLGENIADNGGIREAFQAYQAYVDRYGEEPRLPGLEEFSPEHIFYLGFANPWCELKSPKMALELLALDAHSPGKFRVQGSLSNDEAFSKVWNCPAGSPMNHGNERCLLW